MRLEGEGGVYIVWTPDPSARLDPSSRGQKGLGSRLGYTYLFGSYLAEAAPGCWLSLSTSGSACPSSLSDALADESSSWGSHGGVEIGPGGPMFDNSEEIWGLLRHQYVNYSPERLPSALSLFLCRFCCNCSFFCLLLNGFFRGIVQVCRLSTTMIERAKRGNPQVIYTVQHYADQN